MRDRVASGFSRRILMTADAVGGVWQYAMDLSRGLRSRGADVHVAVMGPSPSRVQRDEAASLGLALYDAPFALEWMDEPWAEVDLAGDWLLDLDRTIRPDVVHLNGYAHGSLPWSAPVLVVGHSCVCSWWRAVHSEDAPARLDTYRRRVRAGLRAAHAVVAPSGEMLAEIDVEYGPLPASRVIPNGRVSERAVGVAKEPVVFAGGRLWDAAKNIETLCGAAPDVEWPVYVAGDSIDPGRARVELPGVRVLGRLTPRELQQWYARAMIYALPARYEPFGLSVLEAANAGCALVLGDIRSLRENWNGAALFVPPDNRRALASALSLLAADEDRRLALAAAATARAAHFTVDRMTDGYLSMYRELAPAHAATR